MTYFPGFIDATGLHIPSYNDIFEYYLSQYQTFYGQNVTTDDSNADVQMLSILALAAADVYSALQMDYTNRAPNFAIGAALASLGSLIGIAPLMATFSTVSVTITGTPGTVITNGVVTDTVFGFRWDLPATVTIAGGGTVAVTATCETLGAVNVGASTVTGIATPAAGWASVTNSSPSVPGQAAETDSEFRGRYALSVQLPSQTILSGTVAAVLAVPGVTRYQIDENTTGTTNSNGTFGHSIQLVVEGGDPVAIAQAIYFNKGIGCGTTTGSVTEVVVDPFTGISQSISFTQPPASQNIFIIVNVHLLPSGGTLSSDQVSAIKTALVNYLNALPIGALVSFGDLIQVAAGALGSAVSIRTPFFFGTSASPSTSTDVQLAFGTAAIGNSANITVNSV